MPEFVKHEAGTDPAHGCRPEDRTPADHVQWGTVLLDKPPGITSRRAADRVCRLAGADRAGHGGTLDPMVTGVLPVLLGRSTRVAQVLLGCDKAYAGRMRLHGEVSDAALEAAVAGFRGVTEQVPPVRSRVKRQPRKRRIEAFDLLGRDGREVRFSVHCEGGTYIRKLVHDLGQRLGIGAHMTWLRRTQSGPFGLDECVTLDEMEKGRAMPLPQRQEELRRIVRPVEELIGRMLPCVRMDDGAVHSVCTGYPLTVAGVCTLDGFKAGDRLAAMTLKGELVGLGEALMGTDEIIGAERGLAVRLTAVLMRPGRYPEWRRRKE